MKRQILFIAAMKEANRRRRDEDIGDDALLGSLVGSDVGSVGPVGSFGSVGSFVGSVGSFVGSVGSFVGSVVGVQSPPGCQQPSVNEKNLE